MSKPMMNITSLLISLALIVFIFLLLQTATASELDPRASAYDKYEGLIMTLNMPQDAKQYSNYYDFGKEKAVHYGGKNVPPAYWVYVEPTWYIWAKEKKLTADAAMKKATAYGKYRKLLKTLPAPGDREKYGDYKEDAYYGSVKYLGQTAPAGYWVYVAPNWYIWGEKDLAAAGFDQHERKIDLSSGSLTVRVEFQAKNADWAKHMLDVATIGFKELETMTGKPFPGNRPYPIEERVNFGDSLGKAGKNVMMLAPPPKGTPWTVLHESVHIWNVDVKQPWLREGLANFVSYLIMKKHGFKFYGIETWDYLISAWKKQQDTGKDYPLQSEASDAYGKSMEFWAIGYQLYGEQFIQDALIMSLKNPNMNYSETLALIRKHSGKDPTPFMAGWFEKRPYKIKKASDFGVVKYPLP